MWTRILFSGWLRMIALAHTTTANSPAGERFSRRPDFMGIGAQKAGTTWVFSRLEQHPDVVFPAGKEVHFWDLRFQKGTSWYFSRLGAPASKKVGDITPAYAILPRPRIEKLAAACPDTQFFMILRNPLERAWSLAKMNAGILFEATRDIKFEGRPGLEINDLSDGWWKAQFKMKGSLVRGMYDQSLDRWLSVVERDRLLVLHYEELVETPREFLNSIATHCGITTNWFDQKSDSFFSKKVFYGANQSLPERFKPFLRELYGESIKNLSARLGGDYSHWLE